MTREYHDGPYVQIKLEGSDEDNWDSVQNINWTNFITTINVGSDEDFEESVKVITSDIVTALRRRREMFYPTEG